MVANYLKAVTRNEEKGQTDQELSPIVKSLTGSIKLPEDFDYEKAVSEAINERYGS